MEVLVIAKKKYGRKFYTYVVLNHKCGFSIIPVSQKSALCSIDDLKTGESIEIEDLTIGETELYTIKCDNLEDLEEGEIYGI